MAMNREKNGFSQNMARDDVELSPLPCEISVNRTRPRVDLLDDVLAGIISRASRRLVRLQATQQGHSNGCEEED